MTTRCVASCGVGPVISEPQTEASRDVGHPTAHAGGARTTDFSLVVGVDHYPRFRSLNGAIADAERFHAWLRDPKGGDIAKGNAHKVLSKAEPISPLQDEVDEELLEIIRAADALGGGHRLYFHFSGHGAGSLGKRDDEDVALLLAKWSLSLARLALSKDEYNGVLRGMGLFDEIVISLDCCRAAARGAVGLPPTITHEPRTPPRHTRTFIAYATEEGQTTFETRDGNLWSGVFTNCLLEILRSAPHGIIAADLKRELEYAMESRGQRAYIVNGLEDSSRFGHQGTLPRLLVRFVRAVFPVCLRNGMRSVIARCDQSTPKWELLLEPGLYKLEGSDGSAVTFEHTAKGTHVAL